MPIIAKKWMSGGGGGGGQVNSIVAGDAINVSDDPTNPEVSVKHDSTLTVVDGALHVASGGGGGIVDVTGGAAIAVDSTTDATKPKVSMKYDATMFGVDGSNQLTAKSPIVKVFDGTVQTFATLDLMTAFFTSLLNSYICEGTINVALQSKITFTTFALVFPELSGHPKIVIDLKGSDINTVAALNFGHMDVTIANANFNQGITMPFSDQQYLTFKGCNISATYAFTLARNSTVVFEADCSFTGITNSTFKAMEGSEVIFLMQQNNLPAVNKFKGTFIVNYGYISFPNLLYKDWSIPFDGTGPGLWIDNRGTAVFADGVKDQAKVKTINTLTTSTDGNMKLDMISTDNSVIITENQINKGNISWDFASNISTKEDLVLNCALADLQGVLDGLPPIIHHIIKISVTCPSELMDGIELHTRRYFAALDIEFITVTGPHPIMEQFGVYSQGGEITIKGLDMFTAYLCGLDDTRAEQGGGKVIFDDCVIGGDSRQGMGFNVYSGAGVATESCVFKAPAVNTGLIALHGEGSRAHISSPIENLPPTMSLDFAWATTAKGGTIIFDADVYYQGVPSVTFNGPTFFQAAGRMTSPVAWVDPN